MRGVDAHRRRFDLEADLDNLGAGGLYIRLDWQIEQGAPLWASFRLPAGPGMEQIGTRWTAQGVICRVETQPDGICGLGVEFTNYNEI